MKIPTDDTPAGTYEGICFAVIDIGTQPPYKEGDNPKRQLMAVFEYRDGDGQARTYSEFYTASLNEKAKLRSHIDTWGLDADTFDTEKLVMRPGHLTFAKKPTGKMGLKAVTPLKNYETNRTPIHFDMSAGFDAATYDTLSEFQKEKIAASPEGAAGLSKANGEMPQDTEIPF